MAVPERAERPDLTRPAVRPLPATPPGRAAFHLLRVVFTTLPLVAGADKFLNVLAPWQSYLSPDVPDLLGVAPWSVMHAVGALEIFAGLMVALRPTVGAWLVAVWLWIVAANLLTLPGYYDVALRDLALSLAAVALARLAPHFARRSKR